MINPQSNLKVFTERPSPHISRWMRVVAPVVCFLRIRSKDEDSLDQELQTLLSNVSKCNDRAELELLLGPPDYAMSGECFGQTDLDGVEQKPDLVECYSRGRLHVELWFRRKAVWQSIGFVMPATWDFVCGIEPKENRSLASAIKRTPYRSS